MDNEESQHAEMVTAALTRVEREGRKFVLQLVRRAEELDRTGHEESNDPEAHAAMLSLVAAIDVVRPE